MTTKKDVNVQLPRCYEGHVPIELGGGIVLGRSCWDPLEGYDVYVGLDGVMSPVWSNYPWVENPSTSIHFPIRDAHPPHDAEDFAELVEYLGNRLQKGSKVHIGCIGGHGRTGLLITALAAKAGVEDPIAWVRKVHCKKAVETSEQVSWLVKHYGVKTAAPTKSAVTQITQATSNSKHVVISTTVPKIGKTVDWLDDWTQNAKGLIGKSRPIINPVISAKSIWKKD